MVRLEAKRRTDMSTSTMHGETLICGWSVIEREWVGLKNNGLFPLSWQFG